MLSAFSEVKDEYQKVKNIFNSILAIYGIIVLIFSIYHTVIDFETFISKKNLQSFLLGPVFTTIYLPFIYLTALYMIYESFYVRIKWNLKDNEKLAKFIKWRIFLTCKFNLNKIKLVSKELKVFFIKDKTELKFILRTIMIEGKHPVATHAHK